MAKNRKKKIKIQKKKRTIEVKKIVKKWKIWIRRRKWPKD